MSKVIVSATKGDCKNTQLFKSLQKLNNYHYSTDGLSKFKSIFSENNRRGLPEVYNKFLNQNVEWLIFVHDDVYIDDYCLFEKLDSVKDQFDIVGLAGATECKIEHPALWHIMGGGFGSGNLRGYVMHPAGQNQIGATGFGPTPSRVVVIDGLFMAVKVSAIKKVGWKFNENYKFHCYDISSCLDAHKLGLRIGVVPINVIHSSPGLKSLDDPEWSASNKKFLEEYKNFGTN